MHRVSGVQLAAERSALASDGLGHRVQAKEAMEEEISSNVAYALSPPVIY